MIVGTHSSTQPCREIGGVAVVRYGIQGCVRNTLRRHGVPLARALVATEVKELVFLERPAEATTELILLQHLLGGAAGRIIAVIKEVIGIEMFIAEKLKS